MNNRHRIRLIGLGFGLSALMPLAYGTATDLAPAPLITSAPQIVQPNLMFVLDDSGSMDYAYMPDDANNFNGRYGYASAQCNGVFYNPNITYLPPVTSTGASYTNATFTGAWVDGYNTGSGTTNLSTSFRPSGSYTAEAAYYYRYSGSQTTEALKNYFSSSSTFYQECNSGIGNTPGSGVFTKVVVAAGEQQNFANWYSYYRTRMLSMKSAAGRAFSSIGDRYRVGYMSINNNVSPSFLNFATFDATQKAAWYTKLYAARPNSSTPLRTALSNIGRIYGGQLTSLYGETVTDPLQYSCQKNFTILSTDGYWNGGAGSQLDGTTAIGNQDGTDPRPYNDGTTSTDIYTATITIAGATNTVVNSITIGGREILSGATSSNNDPTRVARSVRDSINACTASITGTCQVAGYSAVRAGSVVTITAPASITGTPVIVKTGLMTVVATPFVGGTVTTAGSSESLADVAAYYYKTDLRTTGTLATNNVVANGDDDASWQHMTTFTLGLGARGRMVYDPLYKTSGTGDYAAVATGATASSTVCTWQASGETCNWPVPGSDQIENIDDLWHAAVNGRGTYFSASDPSTLAAGLTGALQSVDALTRDTAAATTSNPNLVPGDNYIFASTFRSADWYGDLERFTVDLATGLVGTAPDWQARAQLDANTTRTIYTYDSTNATTRLRPFLWANLTATEQAWFTRNYLSTSASPTLSQFCLTGITCLSAANQTAAGDGPTLVNYLRGDRTNEGQPAQTTRYFRQRTSVLGDIVNSEAVYVKVPRFNYTDTGYATFKSTNAARQAVVYVGSNDGMLHAFNADTGAELWAYVPQMLLPKLYRLADKEYPARHEYYVDGSPTQADVRFADGTWHTILIGGLGGGGRGYFALDITNPASPRALWEFGRGAAINDDNVGYTYGKPEVAKLANGRWAVFLTSGYNNVNPGDGQGRLYILDPETGAAVITGTPSIATGAGSSTGTVAGICSTAPCPSGLAQIRTWVENAEYDNTTTRVYGGDLFGNLWRFDVNNSIPPSGYEAVALATLRNTAGAAQPLTARPELGKVGGRSVVFVGTGRYLGATDLADTSQQSIYAIRDDLGATGWGNPRADAAFVQQTLSTGTCPVGQLTCSLNEQTRTASNNPVNFASDHGWYVDLPGTRERANTDPQLALGTLAVSTNLPDGSACSVGGTSFLNFFDYRTGAAVQNSSGIVSVSLGNTLAARTVLAKVRGAGQFRGQFRALTQLTSGNLDNRQLQSNTGVTTNRKSWRELVNE